MRKIYRKLSMLGTLACLTLLSPVTAQTPYMVKDITAGSGNSMNQSHNIVDLNGIAYFPATNSQGQELWRSDGTDAGTYMVKELVSGSGSGMGTGEIGKMGNLIFFGGGSSDVLYKSDGTSAGTVPVSSSPLAHTSPVNFIAVNNILFFNAAGGSFGTELWKTDGTVATMVKDIRPGSLGSASTGPMINYNGILYFNALDGTNGGELWKSDGTDAGTVMVKNIHPTGSSNPANFVIANNILFFTADDGTNGRELWKTDGTDAGTVMIKDIWANGSAASINYTITSSYSYRMVEMNGKIYFPAIGGSTTGQELWTSDGTDAGTVMVKDIFSGTSDAQISNIENINGTLYFQAVSSGVGLEPWKSDGTDAGTVMISDINSGSSSPLFFTGYNNEVYFFATKSGFGTELWKSDGTSVGTSMVMDIRTGTSSGVVQNPEGSRLMQSIGGKLFFVANDGINGAELWTVDASGITGISASSDPLSFKMYPNPAIDKIVIESGLKEGIIQLINMQGQTLQTVSLESDVMILDIQSLVSGMYLIKISTVGKTEGRTLIKK